MKEQNVGFVREIKCETAEEFLDILRPSNANWRSGHFGSRWFFRGQHNAHWPLLPSAWRSNVWTDWEPLFRSISLVAQVAQFGQMTNDKQDLLFSSLSDSLATAWNQLLPERRVHVSYALLQQLWREVGLVGYFGQIADEVAHPLGSVFEAKAETAMGLFQDSPLLTLNKCVEDIIFAAAQHHGVPTRLLDWTYNSLVAAFFAVDGLLEDQECDCVVWAMKRKPTRLAGLKSFQVPRHQLAFLHAQAGCFLWDPSPYETFVETGNWRSQLDVLNQWASKSNANSQPPFVYKIMLSPKCATKVVELLWYERVSRAHLMPTLDNVSRTLKDTSRHFKDTYGPTLVASSDDEHLRMVRLIAEGDWSSLLEQLNNSTFSSHLSRPASPPGATAGLSSSAGVAEC